MKRILLIQAGILVLVLALLFGVARSLPVVDYIAQAQREIAGMELWGGVLYPLFFAACNVLLLPAGVVAIGSGFFFGLWWGFFLNLAGSVCGAAVAFGISRKLGRGWLSERFLRHRKWAALDEAIGRHGWKIIFLSQVHPLFPTSLLIYLYGITRIRFSTCILWVALGQAPGLFLYSYLGTLAQLGLRAWHGQTHPQWYEYVLWAVGLGLAFAVTVALGQTARRVIAEVESTLDCKPEPTAGPFAPPAFSEPRKPETVF